MHLDLPYLLVPVYFCRHIPSGDTAPGTGPQSQCCVLIFWPCSLQFFLTAPSRTETGKNQISALGCWWASSSVASHRKHCLLCWGPAFTHHFLLNLKLWGKKSVACTHENGVCMFFSVFFFLLQAEATAADNCQSNGDSSHLGSHLFCSLVGRLRPNSDRKEISGFCLVAFIYLFNFQVFWPHKLMIWTHLSDLQFEVFLSIGSVFRHI